MDNENGAQDLAQGRVPDAREEAGFLPKEKLDALDPDVRARVVALARENSGLREQNEKLFARIATPAPGNGNSTPPKSKSQAEELADENAYPTDRLVEYTQNALELKAALRAMEPDNPRYKELAAEFSRIDPKVLQLAQRELIRREAEAVVKPRLEQESEERGIAEMSRNLFAPVINNWGESALSDAKGELFTKAQKYYAERLSSLGGPEKTDRKLQMVVLRWAFDTAEADLARAGVAPMRSRGRLEDMGGGGGGGSAQPGAASAVANQVLALHKQGKSAEAARQDLLNVLGDRSYKPVFRPS